MDKQQYYYLTRNKLTNKITDIKFYDVAMTQEEMDKLAIKHNQTPGYIEIHECVTDTSKIELLELALKWRSSITLKDVRNSLRDIHYEIDNIQRDIDNYIQANK